MFQFVYYHVIKSSDLQLRLTVGHLPVRQFVPFLTGGSCTEEAVM